MKFAGKRQRFYLIKAYRRSKTLRCRSRRCNCKWIDSLETPDLRGPKVQRTKSKQESAVIMNISWHMLLLVRISQATGRRRYWTDILKIIFLIPCIRLYICSVYGVFISIHVIAAKPAVFNCFRMNYLYHLYLLKTQRTCV